MVVLGIDTSFDDTAAAVVEDGYKVISNVVVSQLEVHKKYGGIIPEKASRKHLENIIPVINEAISRSGLSWEDIGLIAVTNRPGLLGSLLVGLNTAKALSYMLNKPLVAVHHILAHIYSVILDRAELPFPHVALVVSGGHTYLIHVKAHLNVEIVGFTLDDAAGEAFDKVARLLGKPMPGGPAIEKLAQNGKPIYPFPRPKIKDRDYNFSFSGLKTAVARFIEANPNAKPEDIAASFQEAVVEVLIHKTIRLAKELKVSFVTVTGGVAANTLLRERIGFEAQKVGIDVLLPPKKYATDNAAMVASLGYFVYTLKRKLSSYDEEVFATAEVSP